MASHCLKFWELSSKPGQTDDLRVKDLAIKLRFLP